MSIGIVFVAAATLAVGSDNPPVRELISWRPVGGLEMEYWSRYGSWTGEQAPIFTEWQTVTRLTVLAVEPGKAFVQTKFLTMSSSTKAGEWRSFRDVERYPVTTQRLNDYGEPLDAEKALPVNRFDRLRNLIQCGIRYPHNAMAPQESWTIEEFGRSPLKFTYIGKEKIRNYDCFKVNFEKEASLVTGESACTGTYWLDSEDGKVVRLQVGSRQELLDLGSNKATSGIPNFFEMELLRSKKR